jgi:flavin-dependent dehydrogenase
MSQTPGKRIAIVGAGIAGLRCAELLKEHADVEIFEAREKNKDSRPFQMEGGMYYCAYVPDLKPTHTISEIIFSSEKQEAIWKGKIGYTYKIGGTEGLDAQLRQEVEKSVKIHYSSKITSLNELKDFDIIVGADGYRSKIAQLAGMRKSLPKAWGVGIGSTVKGDFSIGKLECTFQTKVAPGGYRYLIPISEQKATLASACIVRKIDTRNVRERLREFARVRDLNVLEEWTDFEKWYDFNTYQKENTYLIGAAASLSDQSYGFGLKYSIISAKLCAKAIIEGRDYNFLIQPTLKELRYWENIGRWLINSTDKFYDRQVKLANNFLIKNRVRKGKSIAGLFRLLKLM